MQVISESSIDLMDRRFSAGTPSLNASTSSPKSTVGSELDQDHEAQSPIHSVGNKATELAISLEASGERIVVKILDSETKEVIKQIPDEDLLALAEDLHQRGLGLLNQTA
jgi:flagellar protein FlaG